MARRLHPLPEGRLVNGLRIVFIAPRSRPAVGGMESYLGHLTNELARRHDVTVLALSIDGTPRSLVAETLGPAFEPFEDGGVRVLPLRASRPARRALLAPLRAEAAPVVRRYAWGRARRAASLLYATAIAPAAAAAARGADVVHMWGGDMLGVAAAAAARAVGAPLVVTPFAHDGQWGDDPASRAAYRAADRLVALLESEAAFYRQLGAPAGRVAVAGVCSPGVPAGGGRAVRARAGVSGPLVLFLGWRRAYKGVDLLLEAAPLVAAARSDVTFAFAGPGPAILPDRTGARILDLGEVDEADRAAWLEAADVLCLPSSGEIFPVSILEAWSVGTPVVTSDIPPLAELLGGTGGGLTAPRRPAELASTLVQALADPERLRDMGARGREAWRSRYSVDVVARTYEEIYRAVARPEAACAA